MGELFGQGAFIARHGSWNRIPASGYDVVFVAFDERGNPVGEPRRVLEPFLARDGETIDSLDWEEGDTPEGTSWGRLPDGAADIALLTPTPGAPNVAWEGDKRHTASFLEKLSEEFADGPNDKKHWSGARTPGVKLEVVTPRIPLVASKAKAYRVRLGGLEALG